MALARAQIVSDLEAQFPDAPTSWYYQEADRRVFQQTATPEQMAAVAAAREEGGPRAANFVMGRLSQENAATQQRTDAQALYASAAPELAALRADPTSEVAFNALFTKIEGSPLNTSKLDTGVSDVTPTGFQAPLPVLDTVNDFIGQLSPEDQQVVGSSIKTLRPDLQGTPWYMKLATAAPFAALGAMALPALTGAAAAPAVTGSAAAPFGFGGGVGGSLATAAGLPGALGAAGAAIPNIPTNLFADAPTPQAPTPPTPRAPSKPAPLPGIPSIPDLKSGATGIASALTGALTDPSVLGGIAGGIAGAGQKVTPPTLQEPTRIARAPIEQDILRVTEPRLQRQIDLQAQERAATRGATGGVTSGEIFRDQLQRQLGTESMSQNALNAMLSSHNLQQQQQTQENAFANAINAARLGQTTSTQGVQQANLANLLGGATAGAQFGDLFRDQQQPSASPNYLQQLLSAGAGTLGSVFA